MNTTYFCDLSASTLFGKYSTPVVPSSYYVGVSSTLPTIAGTGVTEPSSSSGYARIQLENSPSSITRGGTGTNSNTNALNFNESTASWGVMNYWVVFDALQGGNLLMFGQLDPTRTVEPGTTLTLAAGQIQWNVPN